ncbi:MAG: T9SS type A sorting domain-containing protein [Flavobacteriales bacterium]
MKRYLLFIAFLSFAYGAFAALTVGIAENSPAICTYPSGSLSANIDGGVPPYSYLWNTGETTSTVENLTAGLYSVTVTDDLGTQATASRTLAANNPEGYVGGFQACPDGVLNFPFRMLGPGNLSQVGMMPITFQNGNFMADLVSSGQPYETALYLGDVTDNWPAPGTVLDLPFTDASGCPGVIHAEVPAPFAYPVPQVLAVDGACSGGSNGGVLVHVPVAQHPWPNYIDLLHDGMPFGPLEYQDNPEQSFGKVPHTVQRNDLPAGEYAMVVWTRFPSPYEWLEQQFYPDGSYCGDTTWFTVPDLGYACGTVSGTAYMDDNFNCTRQYNEVPVPATVMEIQPGGYFTLTNASGAYHQNVPYGSYTVQQQSTAVSEHCAGVPQAFSLSAGMLSATRNFPDTTLLSRDVEIDLSSSYARPGFQMSYVARVKHLTAGATGAMTITLDFDPLLSFVSGTPTPASVVGNTVTWNVAQLTSFGIRSVGAYFQVPPDVTLIGTSLSATATVGISQPEQNIANNTDTDTRTITGAYDPNAKEVSTSSGWSNELYYIDQDAWLNYTIQFQNTGTDTAFFVVITDTLPETLDPTTFNLGASSHTCMVEMVDHGVLRFFFPNILLPDSNVNEPRSHGFVSFRIQPRLPLTAGTEISNIANIYFDYNPPVITEPSILTAEFSTGVQAHAAKQNLWLMPNPTSGMLEVRVSDNSASGLLQVVSVDGRVVMQQRMEGPRTMLDVTSLARGLYTLNWHAINGTITTQRFVRE